MGFSTHLLCGFPWCGSGAGWHLSGNLGHKMPGTARMLQPCHVKSYICTLYICLCVYIYICTYVYVDNNIHMDIYV